MCIRLATYRITPAEPSQLQAMHEASAAIGDIPSRVNAYDEFDRLLHEAIKQSNPRPSSWRSRQFASPSARLSRHSGAPSFAMVIGLPGHTRSTARSCVPWRAVMAMRRPVLVRTHVLNASGALASYINTLDGVGPLFQCLRPPSPLWKENPVEAGTVNRKGRDGTRSCRSAEEPRVSNVEALSHCTMLGGGAHWVSD